MENDDINMTEEVAKAYQSLTKETPPTELDERILQASRESVQDSPSNKNDSSSPYNFRRYSIAASVCLSVLIVSMVMRDEPSLPQASKSSSNLSIESLQAPIRESTALESDENRSGGNGAAASRVIDVGAVQTQRVQIRRTEAADFDVADSQELEEVVVTAFRTENVASMAAAISIEDYRNSSEQWLSQIQLLLETDEAAAQEEIALFIQAYPEIEVESALSELED